MKSELFLQCELIDQIKIRRGDSDMFVNFFVGYLS